jgi:hypothetical protein
VRLVACHQDDQKNGNCEWSTERQGEVGHHDECRASVLGRQFIG